MPDPSTKRLLKYAPDDKSAPDFQSFISDFFTNKKKYKPPTYANLIGEGNRCNPPTRLNKRGKPIREPPKLSLHQLVVNTVMKVLAYNPKNTNRGLLAWHSTGSGKTLTATAVMDAFWDTNRHIVYVSSVEGKNSNPPENFYALARKFLTRFRHKRFTSPDPEAELSLVEQEFKRRQVKFMTFAQLAHYLLISKPLNVQDPIKREQHKNFLDNAIVIMDEVHNIFKPLPNQKSECDALRKFIMDPNNKRAENLKIVVLTATPGESPADIIDLLNIVRDPKRPTITTPNTEDPKSMQQFKESIRGLVSFFDMSGDYTKFPRVENLQDSYSNMSNSQFEAYAQAYHKSAKDSKTNDFNKLAKANKTKRYYEYARKYSNMMFKVDDATSIPSFSSKLADLVEQINKYPNEKHYVYSSFFTKAGFGGQGIVAISKVLADTFNYTELRAKDITKAVLQDPTTLESAKRFIVATTPYLKRDGKNAGTNLKKFVQLFNSKENSQGQKVQLFLASQGYNEGVDLRGVRHIHIFDPLVTIASEKQTIGRAARHCSHSDLSLQDNEWTVKVHRYYADKPLQLDMADEEKQQAKVNTYTTNIEDLERRLLSYKGMRREGAKQARNNIKEEIKQVKDQRKLAKRELRKIKKLNVKAVNMVDTVIRQEALDRMKTLNTIYSSIYESAIDCHLFKTFHDSAGYNIQCDPIVSIQKRINTKKGTPTKQAVKDLAM